MRTKELCRLERQLLSELEKEKDFTVKKNRNIRGSRCDVR